MDFDKKRIPIFVLLLVSIFLHFSFLWYPEGSVYDEFYTHRIVNGYLTNDYFFNTHPPFGKLLIAGFAKITGYDPTHIETKGSSTTVKNFLILRFLPALLGSLLPLLIYLILRELQISPQYAFLGAFLAVFDNALLTQSKFALLDIPLLFFGFLSLYFLLLWRRQKNPRVNYSYFTLSVLAATLALSIKWNGLLYLGMILLVLLVDLVKNVTFTKIKNTLLLLSISMLIPLLLYYSFFFIHFKLFSSFEPQKPIFQKFIEANQAMLHYHATLRSDGEDSSKWFQWMFDKNPVLYWTDSDKSNIFLIGNPLIWWSVLLSILFSLGIMFSKKIWPKLPAFFFIFLAGYAMNLFPYLFIKRYVFLYHYLPSLIFGILLLAILADRIISPWLITTFSKKVERYCYIGFLSLCIISFIMLAPLSYGFSTPSSFYNNSLIHFLL